jgi:hypothetical protein
MGGKIMRLGWSGHLSRRSLLAVALLGTLLGLSVGPTIATNSGSNAGGYNTAPHPCDKTLASQCAANGMTHRVSLASLASNSPMRAAMLDAMNTIDNLSPDIFLVVEWSSSTNADVNATTGNFGNTGWWAYGACSANSTITGTDPLKTCTLQVITYNVGHPSDWDGTALGRRTIACHELGHTVGLRHSNPDRSSCMRNGVTTMDSLHSHDHATLANLYD